MQCRLKSCSELLVLLLHRLRLTIPIYGVRVAGLGALLGRAVVSTLDIVRVQYIAGLIPLNTQLDQLGEYFGEVCEEPVPVPCIKLHPWLEGRIGEECEVGRKHHELFLRVLVKVHELADAVLESLLLPVQRHHELEVSVAEARWVVYLEND